MGTHVVVKKRANSKDQGTTVGTLADASLWLFLCTSVATVLSIVTRQMAGHKSTCHMHVHMATKASDVYGTRSMQC